LTFAKIGAKALHRGRGSGDSDKILHTGPPKARQRVVVGKTAGISKPQAVFAPNKMRPQKPEIKKPGSPRPLRSTRLLFSLRLHQRTLKGA